MPGRQASPCTVPEWAEYKSREGLELVHGDFCGPITLRTPGGKKFFLLMVDDFNKHMWTVLLPSKDCATEAIKRVQAELEAVSGKKRWCLRTNRGEEFISIDFSEHCAVTGVQR
jgi:hypothetical protein